MTGVTFQINNKDNIEIVNDTDPMMNVVYSGNQSNLSIQRTWPAWPEPPTVFIRPAAESWCGGFTIYQRRNNQLLVYCKGNFDWVMCCSPTSWNPGGVRTFGLETFKGDGSLLFSTNNRFARITTIVPIPGPVVNNSGSIIQGVAPLAGWQQMPWINVSQATLTRAIVAGGGDLSYQESYLIKVNAARTELRMTIGDTINPSANQLQGKTAYFPMGFIAGN
ncbi:hypothetical protein HOT57_gp91 [Pseudomonas phage phCDa]|uniref:Uncharacterized protein n=1 Tax=Pseudomonas phage phCDa TaxID=2268587 RepID=A0A2Z5H8Z0_9CAUD|nr:hypothetical protein HOT57_gp91 [Pseudomonas phage phCDa]AXC36535.1 hypothetical protein phCDa_91 [Pseudomonas phage phCDa]